MLISFAATAKLICVFVFAYAKSRFSHNEAQFIFSLFSDTMFYPYYSDISMTQPDADETIDYNYAQQELMLKEFSNDPISEAISAVEQQYEEDKQGNVCNMLNNIVEICPIASRLRLTSIRG